MRAMRHRGLSWARTTFFRASTGRYHSTSSQPVSTPGGTRTRRPPVESRRSWPLEDGSVRCHAEPSSGIEPEPPEYETGARPVELQGQVAPAEGVEPSRVRLTAGCPTVRPRWNDRGAARARRRDDPRIAASMLRAASRTTRAVPLTSQLIGAEFSMNRAPCRRTSPLRRVPSERGSLATRGRLRFRSLVPGAGFEPAFLGSEASVLPARRSRNEL